MIDFEVGSPKGQAYALGRIYRLLENSLPDVLCEGMYFNRAVMAPQVGVCEAQRLVALNHHMSEDLKVRISGLMEYVVEDWPGVVSLELQGVFSLGYYHQTALDYKVL